VASWASAHQGVGWWRGRHLGAYLEALTKRGTRDPESFMRDYGAEELIGNNVRESPIAQHELS
jgi:hypothetical protein